jgi:serine/threonine-protein kinase
MPAEGGAPEIVLAASDTEGYVTPHVLPGGNTALLVVRPGAGGVGNARDGRIVALSLDTGEFRTLIEGGFRPQFAPTGHLLFIRAGALWAVPFDAEQVQITGREVPVLEGVQNDSFRGGAPYAFSDDGMLVYVPGGDTALGAGSERILVWVDRGGREEPLRVEPRSYFSPRLSPDGQRLATRITQGGAWDIWIDDLVRGTSSRLTFGSSLEWTPLWTPDGERVIFTSLGQSGGLYRVAADGTGQAELLIEALANVWAQSLSPDGSTLVFDLLGDIHILSMEGEHTSQPILQAPYLENMPTVSPDGRWMAYQSDESGRLEVYVRPFPDVDDGKWQVSSDGGREPRWGPEGRELFYRDTDMMMVVTVEAGPTFSAGLPSVLFTGDYATPGPQVANYDISPDGQRFLMMKNSAESEQTVASTQLIVVDNWFEELNRLAPPSP